MANTYLSRASYGTPTSTKIFTWSCWFKIGQSQGKGRIFDFYAPPFVYGDGIFFTVGGELGISGGDSNNARRITSRVFRDPSAWYHVVGVFDSPNSVAEDRLRLYVNGVRETSFSASVDMTQNQDYQAFRSDVGGIGTYYDKTTSSEFFDGSMAHIHFIDGTAYDADTFGETDATTGIWKIKTSPSVTYGTNGFFILKDGNSVTDQSGNSNNFTVGGGTLTNTEDNPSNVFATMNPLGNYVATTTLSQGNNTVAMTNSKGGNLSTLGFNQGKYYAEMKIATMPDSSRFHIGILPQPITVADDPIATGNDGIMLSGYNATIYANSGSGLAILNNFYGNATGRFSGNPILGLAIDLSSATKTMAISINGAWVTGSNTTDTDFANALKVDITTPVARWNDWFMGCGSGNGTGTTGVYNWNFGNGYFGTTAVSSAGTNASGNGIFEYDVPTGYTALSTKGLNL